MPGSFEIPLVAQRLGKSGKYAAVICLGASSAATPIITTTSPARPPSGIAARRADADVPVIFGILTCDTLEQAINRAGGKAGNKGFEAALTAIEMVNLMKKLPG